MKVIIAGSRNFNDYELLKTQCDRILDSYDEIFEIVSGGAKGADSLGERYAKEKRYELTIIKADWDAWGKAAGYKRNEDMARYARFEKGILIAFWDSISKGTEHMIRLAGNYGLPTHIIYFAGTIDKNVRIYHMK